MIHIVAISDRHKAHVIQAESDVNLTDVKAVCGVESDRWQLYLPEEFSVKPNLCRRCNTIMFGGNGQSGEAPPVERGENGG
jgi:hypothetical protein